MLLLRNLQYSMSVLKSVFAALNLILSGIRSILSACILTDKDFMKEFDKKGCYSFGKISAVTVPLLFSMLVEHLIGMTDTAFLGRVSEVALGAAALGTVYFLAFFVLGSGFSYGAQILIARRNGEKNFSKIGQICYASGFFLTVIALLLIVLIRIFSDDLMPLMVKSKDVCNAAVEYINYRAFGLLFVFITSLFRAFYVGIARTKILTYASVAMVVSNVVLNYSLIFGKFGMPRMGIAGAAVASAVAEGIAMIFYIVFSLKTVDLKKYGFYAWSACFKAGILKKVFAVSLWLMLQPFISIVVWFFFFIAIERLGERPLAVINLARAVSALPFIIIHACATTANSLISNLIGANKSNQVNRLILKMLTVGFAVVTPMLIFFALFPELNLRVYTDNLELIKASVDVIYVVCIATFLQTAAFILFNSVSGTGAVRVSVSVEMVSLFLYTIFVWWFIIRLRVTPAQAWTGEILYQVVILVLCAWYLVSGRWQGKKL